MRASDARNLDPPYFKGAPFASEPWWWILHGSAPEPGVAGELVQAGLVDKTVGAVGVKQLSLKDGSRLLELGIFATASARRLGGWRDQGQYDGTTDVLGVGTAVCSYAPGVTPSLDSTTL